MNFDKLANSKINAAADWILRLVLINILVIVCSLPLITLYPAFSAGYNVFHDILNKKNVKIFPTFFNYFKEHIGRKILLGILFVGLFFIGFLNVTYYTALLEEAPTAFLQVGYYVTMALIAILYAVFLYSYVVICIYPTMKVWQLFKISFFMAGKYYFITLFIVVINTVPFLMFLYPPTAVLFVFFGVSLPLLLHAIVTRQVAMYLQKLGEKND